MASDLVFAGDRQQQEASYSELQQQQHEQQPTDDVMNSSAETAIVEDEPESSSEEEIDELTTIEEKPKSRRPRKSFGGSSFAQTVSCGGSSFGETRKMPSRASKDSFNAMLGIKRRTIMKPAKRVSKLKDFNLKPSEIKKIYLNKKLGKFKPSCLETIFEEPTSTTSHNEFGVLEEVCSVVGARKLKRALTCSDGVKYNVALVKRRRAKIKSTFGKRFALKKISLEEFLEKLNNSIEKEETTPATVAGSCGDGSNIMESEEMASVSNENRAAAATVESSNSSTSLFNALTLAATAVPLCEKATLPGNDHILL